MNPLQQGLKHNGVVSVIAFLVVAIMNPLQQGLKHDPAGYINDLVTLQ